MKRWRSAHEVATSGGERGCRNDRLDQLVARSRGTMSWRAFYMAFGLVGFILFGCKSTDRTPGAHHDPPPVLSVEPAVVRLPLGGEQPFRARTLAGNSISVRWSLAEPGTGTIDDEGRYVAPSDPCVATVVATTLTPPSWSATATVYVGEGTAPEPGPVVVRIVPSEVELAPGETFEFEVLVTGASDRGVFWEVSEAEGGEIDQHGSYRAPEEEGTFHVIVSSVLDPLASDQAMVEVSSLEPIEMGIVPPDRRTTWNPGIPGGIPQRRGGSFTPAGLVGDGTGDNTTAIQAAIHRAGEAYSTSRIIQEVELPAGTFRFTRTLSLDRSGVVLRGQGEATRLRYDGNQDSPAILLGRARWTDYTPQRGPWALVEEGRRGSKQIRIAAVDAKNIEIGDILGIDEEDDPEFVRMGDGWYGKRQPSPDTHGPALREQGRWRSVGTMIRVKAKHVNGEVASLTLEDPLHLDFRTKQHAQIFHLSSTRKGFDEIEFSGVERLYLTGGTITTNNVSYCWIDGLEIDGNPGTKNIGSYTNPAGISGHSVEFFHAYRCELRNSYIHHSRNITQGGGSYLVTLSGYTAESLVEDNIVVFGNKLIVANMMGGGNVIAYNYVDNARTNSPTWQEGAIDLNHLSFTHWALVEGNWTSNMGADTTHGNSGWHVFHRNFATGQNSSPIYGAHPYTSGRPDTSFRRAVGIDGYSRETTFIGNVLHAGDGEGVYQVDHSAGPRLGEPAVWRIGGGVDGRGESLDDGTALSLLYRHGNWDSVSREVVWDPENPETKIPDSLYLHRRPNFFGDMSWPWVDPLGTNDAERTKRLPAKERYDRLLGGDPR